MLAGAKFKVYEDKECTLEIIDKDTGDPIIIESQKDGLSNIGTIELTEDVKSITVYCKEFEASLWLYTHR